MRQTRSRAVLLPGLFCGLLAPACIAAQDDGLVAKWSFDAGTGKVAQDSVTKTDDNVEGFVKYVPGISGTSMRFDGYTTGVVREGKAAPRLKDAFSIEAWVVLNTYPWNVVPIVDHEADQQVGYCLGIDALGHVTLQVAIDRVWQTVTTTAQLPLKKWLHVVGVFDSKRGLSIYIDGKEAGHLDVNGTMSPLEHAWYGQDDLLIGRVRQPMLPVPSERDNPKYAVMYSLDGILDEVKIYKRSLGAEEIEKEYVSANAPSGEVLPWPALPVGPRGPGRFGAYYTTLPYEDVWDTPRRIALHPTSWCDSMSRRYGWFSGRVPTTFPRGRRKTISGTPTSL